MAVQTYGLVYAAAVIDNLTMMAPTINTPGPYVLGMQQVGAGSLLFEAARLLGSISVHRHKSLRNLSQLYITSALHACAAQDCNLVLYGNNGTVRNAGTAVFATNTYGQGVKPCRLIVSGSGPGGFAVLDAVNNTLYSAGSFYPGDPPATLYPNQELGPVGMHTLPHRAGCC